MDIDLEMQSAKTAKRALVKQLESLNNMCEENVNLDMFQDKVMSCFSDLGEKEVELENLREDI